MNAARAIQRLEDPGDELLADFRRKWVRHVAIQEQVSGMTAEAGRALAQFKSVASSGAVKGNVLHALVRAGGGKDNLRDVAGRLLEAVETSPGVFNVMSEKLTKPKWQRRASELYINFLLSNPATHVVNMTSNTLTAIGQVPEYAAASVIGKARQALTKTQVDRVIASEVGARAFGFLSGAKEGARLFARALRTGEPSDLVSKVEGEEYKASPGPLGSIVRGPTRFLTAEDELFKGVARRMALNGLAVRTAYKQGLRGEAAAKRISELMAAPTDAMLEGSIENGLYLTFQTKLGPAAQDISNFANRHILAKVFLPFVRTPTNLLKFATERSPAAPLLREWRDDFRAGGARRDLAIAKAAIGTGFGMAIYEAAADGRITGSAPTDPKKSRLLYADGWKPYSIKIGDTYYSYRRLDPFAITIGTAADLATLPEGMSDKQREDEAALAIASVMGNLASRTWLSGVSDVVNALHEPARYTDNLLQRLVGSFLVPAGVAGVARTVDPTLREVESIPDALQNRIPGMSDNLLPRRDVWGKPIKNEGGLGPDLLSPVYVSTALNDPVNKQLMQLDYAPGYPSRTVGGKELSAEDYDKYIAMAGPASHDLLTALVESPEWKGMTDEERVKAAKKEVRLAREDARSRLFEGAAAPEDDEDDQPNPSRRKAPANDPFSEFDDVPQRDVVGELETAIPGVRFTSGFRTPEYQADMRRRGYKPVVNSAHLDGSGIDMLPPPGKTLGWLRGKVRKFEPRAKLLVHDGHLHATFPDYFAAPAFGGAVGAGLRNPVRSSSR